MATTNDLILVTGANGQLGRRIVDALLARPAASIPGRIAVSVRDPDKAKDLADRGVVVRRGDFADASSLRSAFAGVSRLVLVSSNAAATGGDPIAQHSAVVDAARDNGVGHVFYTSHAAASATSRFPPMHTHAATEALLSSSGLRWTALRNGFYANSALALLRRALDSGVLETTADGKVAWTSHDDLADAAAAFVVDADVRDGATAALTGPAALDCDDLCAIASDVVGRAVKHVVVDEDTFRARLTAAGLPPFMAPLSLGLYAAAAAGEFSAVDPTLAARIGRPARSLRDVVTAALR